jgi:DNA transposition AAA+ family ATPase
MEEIATLPEIFRFIDQINQFLLLSGWSRERFAKSCGISQATLSQFMNGKYNGDVEKVKVKIATVLEREKEKSTLRVVNPNFIETSVSKRVFDIAKVAHMFCEICVCYADAGTGKTEAAREYAARKSDVILIEADPGYTAVVLFKELHDKLGNGGTHNLHNTFAECVNRLTNSGRLLIIDEAEQLPYRCLEMLRRLHDHAGIGILLLGMPKLLGNLKGFRNQYDQLYSRVGMAAKLNPLTEKDTEEVVRRLLDDTNGLWRVFHKESNGNARRLFKMIKRAIYLADLNNSPIDSEIVMKASSILQVERMF